MFIKCFKTLMFTKCSQCILSLQNIKTQTHLSPIILRPPIIYSNLIWCDTRCFRTLTNQQEWKLNFGLQLGLLAQLALFLLVSSVFSKTSQNTWQTNCSFKYPLLRYKTNMNTTYHYFAPIVCIITCQPKA